MSARIQTSTRKLSWRREREKYRRHSSPNTSPNTNATDTPYTKHESQSDNEKRKEKCLKKILKPKKVPADEFTFHQRFEGVSYSKRSESQNRPGLDVGEYYNRSCVRYSEQQGKEFSQETTKISIEESLQIHSIKGLEQKRKSRYLEEGMKGVAQRWFYRQKRCR